MLKGIVIFCKEKASKQKTAGAEHDETKSEKFKNYNNLQQITNTSPANLKTDTYNYFLFCRLDDSLIRA